jgi:2-polyprenyl-6-methoxyphenol hydroxylase-like FAD-dependent oxidoreductase
MENKTKVCIIGGGTMGTSLANALAMKPEAGSDHFIH